MQRISGILLGENVQAPYTEMEGALRNAMNRLTNAINRLTIAEQKITELEANQLPEVSASDNGKLLKVVDGAWQAVANQE